MARYRVDTVSKAKADGYHIRVLCRCGNNNTLDPNRLIRRGGRVGLTTRVDDLYGILVCKVCKQRPYDVHVTLPMEK